MPRRRHPIYINQRIIGLPYPHFRVFLTNVDYLLAGKRLELKALYELQSDLLPYKLDAFKMFLSRTSQKLLPDNRRQMNIDFINLLFQIVSAPPGDPKRSARLIKHVEEKKQASEWHWLLAKARAFHDQQN